MPEITDIEVCGTKVVLTAPSGTITRAMGSDIIIANSGIQSSGGPQLEFPYDIEYKQDGTNMLHQGMAYRGKSNGNYIFINP